MALECDASEIEYNVIMTGAYIFDITCHLKDINTGSFSSLYHQHGINTLYNYIVILWDQMFNGETMYSQSCTISSK